jgi:hypothetical protein
MSYATSPVWGHDVMSHCHTVRGVLVSYHVTPPCCKLSVVWHRHVGSPHHCSRHYEWSSGPALHFVRMSARLAWLNDVICSHVLQCLSGERALVTRESALGTRDPSCVPRPSKPFFIPDSHGPLRAAGNMAAPKPSSAGRCGPEPWDTFQRRSPPE